MSTTNDTEILEQIRDAVIELVNQGRKAEPKYDGPWHPDLSDPVPGDPQEVKRYRELGIVPDMSEKGAWNYPGLNDTDLVSLPAGDLNRLQEENMLLKRQLQKLIEAAGHYETEDDWLELQLRSSRNYLEAMTVGENHEHS